MDDMKSSYCNVAKRQKKNDTKDGASTTSCVSCIELVLFNIDSLFKISSYLHAVDLLNLELTCKRFGMAAESNYSLSLIEETTRRIVQDITTEERPRNEGESWLGIYHYLRLTQDIRVGEDKRSKNEGETWSAYYQHLQSVRNHNCIAGKLIEEHLNEGDKVLKRCYFPTEEVKLDPEVEKKWDDKWDNTEPSSEAKEMFAKYQGRHALDLWEEDKKNEVRAIQ